MKRLGRRISYVCRALCNVIVILLRPRFLIFVCLLLKKRKIKLWLRATLLGKFNSELVDFLSFIDQFTELNYSSDYQDIFILYQVKLNEIEPNKLFFIDIGGYDGVTKSNTLLLENFGCKGIIVEPNINLLVALKMNRRVFIENSAVIPDFDSHAYYLTYEEGNALGARLIDESSVDSLSPLFRVNFIHVSELISTHRSLIDNYSFVYLSIDIEGPDQQILENFLAIGFTPDFISIEHNHNVFTKAIVKKLAFQYGYKLVFHNFFRNEYMLVKQI